MRLIGFYRIEGVVDTWGLNETFVGLIILPIVGK
jgi:Ca2+/H+ antiporter